MDMDQKMNLLNLEPIILTSVATEADSACPEIQVEGCECGALTGCGVGYCTCGIECGAGS